MSHKKSIVCPACKFPNAPGAKHCLTCKSPLDADPSNARKEWETKLGGTTQAYEVVDPPTSRLKAVRQSAETTNPKASEWLLSCDPLPPLEVVDGMRLTIGRSNECHLTLPNSAISRNHAEIWLNGDELNFADKASFNGCYLNGKRVETAALRVGDVLTLGPYDIEIRKPQDEEVELEGTQPMDLGSLTTGMLNEVPLTQTLQEIGFNHKSGTLKVISGDLRGSLVCRRGKPVTATLGDLRDEPAVAAMLELTEGRFVFTTRGVAGRQTMESTVTALLLDHHRKQDERRNG